MNKIIFDTETTGIPQRKGFNNYFHPRELVRYNSSRIVQIAYIILDKNNNEIKKYSAIIKPDNFFIENSHIHNISQDKAESEGIDFKDMISIFYNDLKNCDTIVAHNLSFDINILLSECYRYGFETIVDEINLKKQYCTMLKAKEILLEKDSKYPRLIELYNYIYNEQWTQIHDATDDCIKCQKCYLKLIELE